MKILLSFITFVSLVLTLESCGDRAGDSNELEAIVMTTDEFVVEAKSLSLEAFEDKYPRDSEIELKGKVFHSKTWEDRVSAHFGANFNDLPLTADFMVDTISSTATKTERKMIGTVHFKGKIRSAFYVDGKFMRCSLTDCQVQKGNKL